MIHGIKGNVSNNPFIVYGTCVFLCNFDDSSDGVLINPKATLQGILDIQDIRFKLNIN